jgi:chemotaxis signal transduction protein
VTGRAEELRRAFDRSFAEPPAAAAAPHVDLLAIRAGETPLALRVAEVTGLVADKAITPVPSAFPELVGVAGFRGAIVPVWRLAPLLGLRADGPPRWMVLVASGSDTFALAFEHLDGHLRVAAAHASREVLRHEGRSLAMVDVRGVIEAVTTRARRAAGTTERER